MSRVIISILLLIYALIYTVAHSATEVIVNGPTQNITVQTQSTVVTPEVVTVTAVVNTVGTEIVEVVVPGSQGIPGIGTGTGEQVNSDWLAVGGVAEILNKPPFNRGYDGKEIELRTTATMVQWRYVTPLNDDVWKDLISIATLTGAPGVNGKSYTCYITGGVQTITYDKNGSNPAPSMVAFAAEMRENGSVVTPATYSWSVPASLSLLSGSASGATFTPTVSGTYSAGAADNRVDVVLTYSGVTCRATAPVAVTKIGADGQAAAPQTKQQLYTTIGAAATGDVLNTQCGAGDADTFAGRTVRTSGGNIHRTDLCGGSTWIHAQSTDTATTAKFGIKAAVTGTPLLQLQADGSLVVKALVIK
ncbi:MAG: hypothetical protein HXX17_11890 [Geobacteraceae bacterium]|nr:hypothetical protein [Geobacteraceae bacterium]